MITAVGMRFRGSHVFRRNNLYALEPEPTNPYDANAIKVMLGNEHVAYVSRDTQHAADTSREYKIASSYVPGALFAYLSATIPPPSSPAPAPEAPEFAVPAPRPKKRKRQRPSVAERLERLKKKLAY